MRNCRTSHRSGFSSALAVLCALVISGSSSLSGSEPRVHFERAEGSLAVHIDAREVARYVYQDDAIRRPYFAPLRTPGGHQVTRNQPPVAGTDAVDHPDMHPGLWMSFGDLSGRDFWRLKAPTVHVRFLEEPSAGSAGSFAVLNEYRQADQSAVVCRENCRYEIRPLPQGYVLHVVTEFQPADVALEFGDQEEMGLGIRMASPLSVDRGLGGRILDSEHRRNGDAVWGQTADWVDYSGPLDGKWVGVTMMTAPGNEAQSWSHARDYGLLVLNPFGRNAFTGATPARRVVSPSDSLVLRFAVVVHESDTEADYDPAAAFQSFAEPKP